MNFQWTAVVGHATKTDWRSPFPVSALDLPINQSLFIEGPDNCWCHLFSSSGSGNKNKRAVIQIFQIDLNITQPERPGAQTLCSVQAFFSVFCFLLYGMHSQKTIFYCCCLAWGDWIDRSMFFCSVYCTWLQLFDENLKKKKKKMTNHRYYVTHSAPSALSSSLLRNMCRCLR